MARKTCTPFCDTKKSCPKHHDLLLGVINCSDRKDQEANVCFEYFQRTVKAHLKKGWDINGVIPDPVRNYRFPLMHWAGVMGKARALEWMINFGFDVTVRTLDSQETALHRSVLCLHFCDARRFREKIKRVVHLFKDCLPLQDKAQQTPLHVAATKLVTGNKADYYSEYLKAMVTKAMEMPGKTAEILNARDQHGNTAMHYLAQSEIGLVPLSSIIDAGGDVSIVNKKKLSALDVAMNNGSTRIIKTLNSAGKKPKPPSCYDNDVYTADSPPESPVNLEESKDTDGNTDTPVLECCEDSSFSTIISEDGAKDGPSDASNEVSPAVTATPCDAENVAPSCTSVDAASAALAASAAPGASDEAPQATCPVPSCDDQDDSGATGDALSVNTDGARPSCEAGPSCEADGTHLQGVCGCVSIGVQTPVINQYSCVVHIKQEKLSPCEKCQQDSMVEISSSSSSEMQSITTTDMANSVITLLRGAGLLDNLTEIAEKKRTEDEHVLTDKLEMVKETNNELESSNKEIEGKKSRIETLSAELEELKHEQERLLRKRKLLNEECNSLQKKLHCCDSLLKVVPKVNLDNSNV